MSRQSTAESLTALRSSQVVSGGPCTTTKLRESGGADSAWSLAALTSCSLGYNIGFGLKYVMLTSFL
eukprot:CAMPEP_0115527154 /NCGR_PEP_ID=MMETSP0271-20121206/82691_1 /TAXON_ID=71861 /ORGANISM="Scrippsiella trochoidea, Strain CCMP3099" /LENGTH=66 /DNA_ID=CAMNT_0002958959 /DNA_START=42 /DNA_END=239 /DNA_ORIENTATION=-